MEARTSSGDRRRRQRQPIAGWCRRASASPCSRQRSRRHALQYPDALPRKRDAVPPLSEETPATCAASAVLFWSPSETVAKTVAANVAVAISETALFLQLLQPQLLQPLQQRLLQSSQYLSCSEECTPRLLLQLSLQPVARTKYTVRSSFVFELVRQPTKSADHDDDDDDDDDVDDEILSFLCQAVMSHPVI